MNLQHLSIISAAASGAALAWYVAAGATHQPLLAVSGLLLAAAVATQISYFRSMRSAERRFRSWCADASAEVPAPTAVPAPFRDVANAVHCRIEGLNDLLEAERSRARRAKVALRSLTREQVSLKSLLESLTDGVLMVDPSGVPVFANLAARRFLSLKPEEEVPTRVGELAVAPALKSVLQEGLKGTGCEDRTTRDVDCSDQTQRQILRVAFLDVTAADNGCQETSRAVLMTDVTREVEVNRMKSNFASSVSHELKTPLSSMKAFLEMMIDGDIEGEQERLKHLRMIMDETERLSRLIQNLLNLSRLEAGITRMEREPVSIINLLAHLRDVFTPLARARSQTIVFEVSDFLPSVTGDRALLEQGIMNLISNAIKYTPEGGSIRIKVCISGRDVELVVSDSGIGIPEKALDLVFEKFTRIENSAGLEATGTGLGLPLAKFVAEAHGGAISVTSVVGEGSEFRLLLPARRGEESNESQLIGLEGISA